MKEKGFYKLAILTYILSLVLPWDDKWFGGVGALLVSGFYSVMVFLNFDLNDLEISGDLCKLAYLLYPYTNIVFIFSAYKFKKITSANTPIVYFLFISTLAAMLLSFQVAYNQLWEVYVVFVWTASFLLLCVAIFYKLKNVV